MQPEFTELEMLLFSLGYCGFMLILSLLFYKFPPKKINGLYGYRTASSMKNKEIWDVANNYWTKLFLNLNVICLAVPVIIYFIYPSQNVLITVIVNTFLLLITIPFTEIHLKKKFNKDGKRI